MLVIPKPLCASWRNAARNIVVAAAVAQTCGRLTRWWLVGLVAMGWMPGNARADVVVITNPTAQGIQFRVEYPKAVTSDAAREVTVPAGTLHALPAIGAARIVIARPAKSTTQVLDANSVYQVVGQGNAWQLRKRPLGGGSETITGTGIARGADLLRVRTIPVRVLVDDEQNAALAIWKKRLRKRVLAASKVIERHCRIGFAVVDFGEWDSHDKTDDFAKSLSEFEREVKPLSGGVVIGFTSQYRIAEGVNRLGGTRGPLHTHILVSEQSRVISEAERLEVLIHELGHYLGAVHSVEATSVMRPLLGDRQARSVAFQIRFDPANTVVMNLVGEEMRFRHVNRREAFLPATRLRMAQVQRVLNHAMTQKRLREMAAKQKKKARQVAKQEKPTPKPTRAKTTREAKPAKVERPEAPDLLAVAARRNLGDPELARQTQTVLKSILQAAQTNAKLPVLKTSQTLEGILFGTAAPNSPANSERPTQYRREGDELTSYYVRSAAAAADKLSDEYAASSLLLALGIALDSSDILLKVPHTGDFCRTAETSTMRRQRLAALGQPTMRGRRDLAQHYVVSAHLTIALGRASAEAAGLAKEIIDSQRGSGFSFADLAANKAGIRLAMELTGQRLSLEHLAETFQVQDYMPVVEGLPEGLSSEDFSKRFGSHQEDQFAAILEEINGRISRLAAYRPAAHKASLSKPRKRN